MKDSAKSYKQKSWERAVEQHANNKKMIEYYAEKLNRKNDPTVEEFTRRILARYEKSNAEIEEKYPRNFPKKEKVAQA